MFYRIYPDILLSFQQAVNLLKVQHGFTNSNRIIRGTDYAKSQGLYCLPKDNGYYGNHYWYTRTPGANSADLYRVGYDGSVAHSYTGTNTDNTYYGIVPAFCFDVSSGILSGLKEGTAIDILSQLEKYIVYNGANGGAYASMEIPEDFSVEINGFYLTENYGTLSLIKDNVSVLNFHVRVP